MQERLDKALLDMEQLKDEQKGQQEQLSRANSEGLAREHVLEEVCYF